MKLSKEEKIELDEVCDMVSKLLIVTMEGLEIPNYIECTSLNKKNSQKYKLRFEKI